MRFRTALALASLPMIRAFARGAQRLRRNVRALAGGAFPSSDRWAPNLVSASDTPTTPVLVLQKDEYEAWLGEQAADTQSYLKAAGLSKFKDDALVLLPERKWAFMTKNASSLYAFASLPARLPSDGAVYELESAEPLPATAGIPRQCSAFLARTPFPTYASLCSSGRRMSRSGAGGSSRYG